MKERQYDYAAVAAALKRTLKKKKISYRDLGDRVGMSESGIKKLMTGDDVSLSRLAEVCRVVGADPLDLLSVAWRPPATPITFTSAQEQFFADNPAHHTFLYALMNMHFDVAAVIDEYDLDQRSADLYIDGLERAGFVDVTVDGRVKPTFDPHAGWFRYKDPRSSERQLAALRVAHDNPPDRRCIRVGRARLTQRHYDEMNKEILDLLLRWQLISTQDELYVDDAELVDIWVLAAVAKQRMSDVLEIPRISRGEPS